MTWASFSRSCMVGGEDEILLWWHGRSQDEAHELNEVSLV